MQETLEFDEDFYFKMMEMNQNIYSAVENNVEYEVNNKTNENKFTERQGHFASVLGLIDIDCEAMISPKFSSDITLFLETSEMGPFYFNQGLITRFDFGIVGGERLTYHRLNATINSYDSYVGDLNNQYIYGVKKLFSLKKAMIFKFYLDNEEHTVFWGSTVIKIISNIHQICVMDEVDGLLYKDEELSVPRDLYVNDNSYEDLSEEFYEENEKDKNSIGMVMNLDGIDYIAMKKKIIALRCVGSTFLDKNFKDYRVIPQPDLQDAIYDIEIIGDEMHVLGLSDRKVPDSTQSITVIRTNVMLCSDVRNYFKCKKEKSKCQTMLAVSLGARDLTANQVEEKKKRLGIVRKYKNSKEKVLFYDRFSTKDDVRSEYINDLCFKDRFTVLEAKMLRSKRKYYCNGKGVSVYKVPFFSYVVARENNDVFLFIDKYVSGSHRTIQKKDELNKIFNKDLNYYYTLLLYDVVSINRYKDTDVKFSYAYYMPVVFLMKFRFIMKAMNIVRYGWSKFYIDGQVMIFFNAKDKGLKFMAYVYLANYCDITICYRDFNEGDFYLVDNLLYYKGRLKI
jgi:hypothetical protein